MLNEYGIPSRLMFLCCITLLVSGLMQVGLAIFKPRDLRTISSNAKYVYRNDIAKQYTWLGDDYPNALPLDLHSAALTIENSRHYALNSSASDAEYLSMYPGNLGFLRLGPNKRFFGIALYHQLHCLDSLRQAIVHGPNHHSGTPKKTQVPHVDHCLNYLRQTILCSADLTLEPEIAPNDVGEGLGVTHVCKDWGGVHDFAADNWKDWKASKNCILPWGGVHDFAADNWEDRKTSNH